MTNYYINLNDAGKSIEKKILDTIGEVKPEDELIISMGADDSNSADITRRLLDERGFEYLPKGNDDGSRFSMIAHLKQD